MRRWGLVLALALALLAPVPLSAHGGDLVFIGRAGPYKVLCYLLRSRGPDGAPLMDYTVSLWDAEAGRPVDGATVMVRVEMPDGEWGPARADSFGNLYQVLIPRDPVGTWRVRVEIDGPLGRAEVAHSLKVRTGPRTWFLWLFALVVIAIIANELAIRRRRRAR